MPGQILKPNQVTFIAIRFFQQLVSRLALKIFVLWGSKII